MKNPDSDQLFQHMGNSESTQVDSIDVHADIEKDPCCSCKQQEVWSYVWIIFISVKNSNHRLFYLQNSAEIEDEDQENCNVTLHSVRVDWNKSLNCMGLKEHQTLWADTIGFKWQHSDEVISLPINDSNMKHIMKLIDNSPSKFEGWRTLKDGVLMSEVVMELSSITSNTQARRSSGVGVSKKKNCKNVSAETKLKDRKQNLKRRRSETTEGLQEKTSFTKETEGRKANERLHRT